MKPGKKFRGDTSGRVGRAFLVEGPPEGVKAVASVTEDTGEPMIHKIIDFSKRNARSPWIVVNDGVMGGHSASAMRGTEDGFGEFAGVLSLENNGGFASTRLSLPAAALRRYDGIRVRVQGDGRTYRLRLRTTSAFDGAAYQREFRTAAGEWVEIDLPFAEFIASHRGRALPDQRPLDASQVEQIGFMIADKQAGPFRLTIAWIAAYRGAQ